jgi:hypothetical protein
MADILASTAKDKPVQTLPTTSRADSEYGIYEVTGTGQNITKERMQRNARKRVYAERRKASTKKHKKEQVQRRNAAPATTSNDISCHGHDTTDTRQSARIMSEWWRKDPEGAPKFNFIYRARRGALLEKAKAISRIIDDEQHGRKPFYHKCYGDKYDWNNRCPCCKNVEERDNHVLHECAETRNLFRKNLRTEVMAAIANQLDPACHRGLSSIPAWFDCGDDNVKAPANSERLKAIGSYNKQLGNLAYIPTALMSWLQQQSYCGRNNNAATAAEAAQSRIVNASYEAWRHRCKLFEEQWREECKRRKVRMDQQQREQQANRAPMRRDPAVAALAAVAAVVASRAVATPSHTTPPAILLRDQSQAEENARKRQRTSNDGNGGAHQRRGEG